MNYISIRTARVSKNSRPSRNTLEQSNVSRILLENLFFFLSYAEIIFFLYFIFKHTGNLCSGETTISPCMRAAAPCPELPSEQHSPTARRHFKCRKLAHNLNILSRKNLTTVGVTAFVRMSARFLAVGIFVNVKIPSCT